MRYESTRNFDRVRREPGSMSPSDDRGHLRSKLNPKMAAALAQQWSF